MHEQGKIFQEIIAENSINHPNSDVLNELLYTAAETGILSESVSEEEAILIYKIVEISRMYRDSCPENLRM